MTNIYNIELKVEFSSNSLSNPVKVFLRPFLLGECPRDGPLVHVGVEVKVGQVGRVLGLQREKETDRERERERERYKEREREGASGEK